MSDVLWLLLQHGYLVVFGVVLLENLGLPVPGIIVLIVGGAFAAAGQFSLGLVVLLAVLAALLGDLAWYGLGRWKGRPVLSFLCKLSLNPDTCVGTTERFFLRYGMPTLVFAKFLPGVNTIMPPLAGVAAMSLPLFLLLDLAGALMWAGSGVALGFGFGEEIAVTARGVQGTMGWLLQSGLIATVAWRIGYRSWLVKRYGGNRVDPEEVHRRMREGEGALVLDLRRDDDYEASGRMIAGAVRVRPASFHRHAAHLPRDRDLIFYCT